MLGVYDHNGNLTTSSSHIGNINPLRYRGYFYDPETGFYYLNSRYYDPETGRFINADRYITTGTGILGFNMFAYCNNNPLNFYDPNGTCIHRWYLLGLVDCDECARKDLSAGAKEVSLSNFNNCRNNRPILEKITDSLVETYCSLTFDVGVGSGVGLSETVDNVEVSVGFHEEMHYKLNGAGEMDLGVETYEGVTAGVNVASVSNLKIGYEKTNFHSYFCEEYATLGIHDIYACQNAEKHSGIDTSIAIIDVGVYLCFGFSFGFSVDCDRLSQKLSYIWG